MLNPGHLILGGCLSLTVGLAVLASILLIAVASMGAKPGSSNRIIGVTDVDLALAQLDSSSVRYVLRPIKVIATKGDTKRLSQELIRYVETDPPDAVHAMDDDLDWGVDSINAELVWGIKEGARDVVPGQGGAGIKVAIVDTGVHCNHEDLTPGCNFGANFVNPPFTGDDSGHGTHVAGLVAARDNGIGTIGTAPEVSLYSVKVLDNTASGTWSAVAAGIVWAADNGMNVVNMSLGGTGFSQAVLDAVNYAHNRGVLIVSAAGNEGGCSTCDTLLYPAKYPNSMAVGAVGRNNRRASFSSTGPDLDVVAPGVNNLSPMPPDLYLRNSGTSMATAHVSGVGALLMSRGLTNVEARQRIRNTAAPHTRDWVTGCGSIDALRAINNVGTLC